MFLIHGHVWSTKSEGFPKGSNCSPDYFKISSFLGPCSLFNKFHAIYQTQETEFHWHIQLQEVRIKNTTLKAQSFFFSDKI